VYQLPRMLDCGLHILFGEGERLFWKFPLPGSRDRRDRVTCRVKKTSRTAFPPDRWSFGQITEIQRDFEFWSIMLASCPLGRAVPHFQGTGVLWGSPGRPDLRGTRGAKKNRHSVLGTQIRSKVLSPVSSIPKQEFHAIQLRRVQRPRARASLLGSARDRIGQDDAAGSRRVDVKASRTGVVPTNPK